MPSSHDYGAVALGSTGSFAFQVRNLGSLDLAVSTTTLTGADPGQFQISGGGGPFTLAPAATRDIVVDFNPTTNGAKGASLRIASDDPDESPLDVGLTGSGGIAPDITVIPGSHEFGDKVVGTSATFSFQVSNDGTSTLNVSETTLTGLDPEQFSIDSGGGAFALAPAASRDVVVGFNPTTLGAKTATLQISSDDPDESLLGLGLAGTGIDEPPPGVLLRELETGGSTDSAVVATSGSVTAVDGHTYLAAVSSKKNRVVFDVQGLGLSWSEIRSQCGARSQTGVSVWTATGTPSAVDSVVTATLLSSPSEAVIVVSRYSGVGEIGNSASANTHGLSGGCSGGSDIASYSVPVLTTTANALVYGAVALRSRNHEPGSGYTEQVELVQGSGGTAAGIAIEDRVFASPGAVVADGTFSGSVDWAVVAVELRPGATTPSPDITVSPLSHEYGNVAVGQSGSQIFNVRNDGTADLAVSATALGGSNPSQFSITSGGGSFALTPGGSRNITIGFSPSTVGAKSASLDITSDDPDEALISVSLSGTGTLLEPDITVSPPSHDYGNVAVGQSGGQVFNVRNDGTANLSVSATSLGGADPGHFIIAAGGGSFVLSPGGSRDITVNFTPSSVGARSASLEITSDDPDEGLASAGLSGVGTLLEPDITVSPTSHGYGTVTLGQSASQAFNVRNDGTTDLSVTSTSLGGANPGDFDTSSGGGNFVLSPGASRDVIVSFSPISVGARSALLEIASNDPDEAVVSVVLAGTGSDAPPPGVMLEQIYSGGSTSSSTVVTSSAVAAVNGDVYLASVTAKRSPVVANVSGMGLVWTELRTQCGGRAQAGISLWTATAGPGAFNGPVTATLSSSPSNALIAVAQYSGVSDVGNLASANTNGTSGGCSGGSDSSSYSVGLSISAPNALVHSVVALRNKSHVPGAGYEEVAEVGQGSGGNTAALAIETREFASAGAVIANGSFSGSVDWAVVAVELRPGAAVPEPDITVSPLSLRLWQRGGGAELEQDLQCTQRWHRRSFGDFDSAGRHEFDSVQHYFRWWILPSGPGSQPERLSRLQSDFTGRKECLARHG